MKIDILPADRFTIQELTDLYNQTRVDYVVPMPMNAERLKEYIDEFDVDLRQSCVACDEKGVILGLSMLGLRGQTAWITRLGVLPSTRRTGAGSALMDAMFASARDCGAAEIHLEVIKNNLPAYNLFLRKGFVETGNYLVMRHAPRPQKDLPQGAVNVLDFEAALAKLVTYPRHLTWINAYESMCNSSNTEGLYLELPNGGRGWLVYRNTKYTLRSTLSHLIMHTEQGDPEEVGKQLLLHLHTRYSHHDTYAENIFESDPHLPAFKAMGYFANFARVEMRCPIQ